MAEHSPSSLPSLGGLPLFQPSKSSATTAPPRIPPRIQVAAPAAADSSSTSPSLSFDRIDWETVSAIRGDVASRLADAATAAGGQLSESDQRAQAQALISEALDEAANGIITREGTDHAWSADTKARLARAVFDALFKLGRLQPLVDQPGVENIDIYGADNVWLTFSDGRKVKADPIADSDEDLITELQFLAGRVGEDARPFTPATPRLHMDLPGGGRLAAIHPPISPRPKAVIRLHRLVDISLDDLVAQGTLTAENSQLLAAAVRAGQSIVVAGFPGAGKTTLVRALANELDPLTEVVTIEKERELHLELLTDRHKIVTALQYRPAQTEGSGAVSLVDLLEDSLRLNAARIIVGEVRGGEVDAMFQAMQAGTGSLSTIHAKSPTDTIERLADLAMKDTSGATADYAYRQITRHITWIVQIKKIAADGELRRVVTEIAQVQPGESDGTTTRPIAATIATHTGLQHMPTPEILNELVQAGLPSEIFSRGGLS